MRVLTSCDEHQHADTKCWVGAPTEYRASKSHQEHDTSCERDHDIEANAGAERRHYLQLSRLTCPRLALRPAGAMLRELSATSRPAGAMWAARQRVDLDRPSCLLSGHKRLSAIDSRDRARGDGCSAPSCPTSRDRVRLRCNEGLSRPRADGRQGMTKRMRSRVCGYPQLLRSAQEAARLWRRATVSEPWLRK